MTQNERRSLPIWKRIVTLCITLFVFAIQIYLFTLMFQINFYNQLNIVLYLVIECIGFIVVMHIIHKPILTSYKLTWSILIMLLPLPFTLLYMLNSSSRRLPHRKQKKFYSEMKKYSFDNGVIDELGLLDSKALKFARVLKDDYPVYKNTVYTFLRDGKEKFEDMLLEIKQAEKYIFIETFIIGDGYLLSKLLPILEQ